MEKSWASDAGQIGLALLLVLANGYFVAAEFALVKVRRLRLERLVREGRPFAGSAQWLYERLDRSLSACQVGITMASLGLGWIGEPAVADLMRPGFVALGVDSPALIHGLAFAVGFALLMVLHLVLGEQVPKILAIRRPEELALWSAPALRAFYVLSYPLLRGLDAATSAILRAAGAPAPSEHEMPHSVEELLAIVSRSHAHGELSRTEQRLVEAVFDFDETVCRQIMVPRPEVVFLDTAASLSENLRIVKRTLHTRYPVCNGSLDRVLGVLHVKDLVGLDPEHGPDVRSLLRPPKFVPETMPISMLLGHFQATRQHLALVVDEFGDVVGIVTFENVLERIVGAVQDEFDIETPDVVADGPGRWIARGGAALDQVAEVLGVPIDAPEVDTLGGLLALRLGRVPVAGDRVGLDGVTAQVLEVQGNRAASVRLIREAPASIAPEPPAS